jgi:hypothetical protein
MLVDEFNRANVDAAGGLPHHEHIGVLFHLARQNDLLLVATGEIGGLEPWIGRPDVERLHPLGRLCSRRGDVEYGAAAISGIVLIAEDTVLPFLKLNHQALGLTILGNMGEAGQPGAMRAIITLERQDVAIEHDVARLLVAHAGNGLKQFGLTVARNAGNADDLAGPHGKAHILDAHHLEVVGDHEVLDLEQRFPRMRRSLFDTQQDAAADHQLGELFG